MKIARNITELIGNTPLIRINFCQNATLLAKCEFLNPSHSVKDRAAFYMIKDALNSGKINKNTTIIEPTSGNMGISLAMICASLGLKIILTMPNSMSVERQKMLSAFGAKLVLTDANDGMQGAVEKSLQIAKQTPNSFMPSQFENPANPLAHFETTANEILRQTDGKIDIFVTSFGTGGTLSGTAKAIKSKLKNIKIIAVEPSSSPLITKGYANAHKIQGIGANFIPKNLDKSLVDEFMSVSDDDAYEMARNLATKEGLFVGISSGANVFAANLIAQNNTNTTIVTILCDTGERYLSNF